MLPIQYIIVNTKKIIQQLQDRGFPNAEHMIQKIVSYNQKRKARQQDADSLRHSLKQRTAQISKLVKQGEKEAIAPMISAIAKEKESEKTAVVLLKKYERELEELLLTLPNLPEEDVPVGKDSDDNVIVMTWHNPQASEDTPRPHWELSEDFDIIDFALGSKITGAGFPVYKKAGAKLQRALINFFLDQATQKGYDETLVPIVVNAASARGTGQLPDKEGMMYALTEKNMYLIPTAEVPLTNLYRDRLLYGQELPIKMVGYTPCFRREAGSWGRHVRGLNRLHQFDKIEIVQIVSPAKARDTLQTMCDYVGSLIQKLGLTYRIVQLCTGDLGFTAAITYDFEVWSAGQKQWLEVSSVSCFNDYQAQRMNLRYRTSEKPQYCYTLNGSAIALPRIVAAILENYQASDHIKLPEVLHDYLGFDTIQKK